MNFKYFSHKLIILTLVLAILLCFVACQKSDSKLEQPTNYQQTTPTKPVAEPDPYYISNCNVRYGDEAETHIFKFSFEDINSEYIKAKATVDIRIVSSNNETVYSNTHNITEDDFSVWTNVVKGEWLAAAIRIYDKDFTLGTSTTGTLYYTIVDGYGDSWGERTLDISNLPVKKAIIKLPTLPASFNNVLGNLGTQTTVSITNITYEIDDDNITFYLSGTKTFDANENDSYDTCSVVWKLYDSEGVVVDSNTMHIVNLNVGEKFKDEKESAYHVIKPGETYTLVLSDAK